MREIPAIAAAAGQHQEDLCPSTSGAVPRWTRWGSRRWPRPWIFAGVLLSVAPRTVVADGSLSWPNPIGGYKSRDDDGLLPRKEAVDRDFRHYFRVVALELLLVHHGYRECDQINAEELDELDHIQDAVESFQRNRSLVVDAMHLDSAFWHALIVPVRPGDTNSAVLALGWLVTSTSDASRPPMWDAAAVDQHNCVRHFDDSILQQMLRSTAFAPLDVNDSFAAQLRQDGVDAATWSVLLSAHEVRASTGCTNRATVVRVFGIVWAFLWIANATTFAIAHTDGWIHDKIDHTRESPGGVISRLPPPVRRTVVLFAMVVSHNLAVLGVWSFPVDLVARLLVGMIFTGGAIVAVRLAAVHNRPVTTLKSLVGLHLKVSCFALCNMMIYFGILYTPEFPRLWFLIPLASMVAFWSIVTACSTDKHQRLTRGSLLFVLCVFASALPTLLTIGAAVVNSNGLWLTAFVPTSLFVISIVSERLIGRHIERRCEYTAETQWLLAVIFRLCIELVRFDTALAVLLLTHFTGSSFGFLLLHLAQTFVYEVMMRQPLRLLWLLVRLNTSTPSEEEEAVSSRSEPFTAAEIVLHMDADPWTYRSRAVMPAVEMLLFLTHLCQLLFIGMPVGVSHGAWFGGLVLIAFASVSREVVAHAMAKAGGTPVPAMPWARLPGHLVALMVGVGMVMSTFAQVSFFWLMYAHHWAACFIGGRQDASVESSEDDHVFGPIVMALVGVLVLAVHVSSFFSWISWNMRLSGVQAASFKETVQSLTRVFSSVEITSPSNASMVSPTDATKPDLKLFSSPTASGLGSSGGQHFDATIRGTPEYKERHSYTWDQALNSLWEGENGGQGQDSGAEVERVEAEDSYAASPASDVDIFGEDHAKGSNVGVQSKDLHLMRLLQQVASPTQDLGSEAGSMSPMGKLSERCTTLEHEQLLKDVLSELPATATDEAQAAALQQLLVSPASRTADKPDALVATGGLRQQTTTMPEDELAAQWSVHDSDVQQLLEGAASARAPDEGIAPPPGPATGTGGGTAVRIAGDKLLSDDEPPSVERTDTIQMLAESTSGDVEDLIERALQGTQRPATVATPSALRGLASLSEEAAAPDARPSSRAGLDLGVEAAHNQKRPASATAASSLQRSAADEALLGGSATVKGKQEATSEREEAAALAAARASAEAAAAEAAALEAERARKAEEERAQRAEEAARLEAERLAAEQAKVRGARDALLGAMRRRSRDELERCLEEAKTVGIAEEHIGEATRLLSDIIEEEHCVQAAEALSRAVRGRNVDQLRQAIGRAKEAGVDAPIVDGAVFRLDELLAEIARREAASKKLRDALARASAPEEPLPELIRSLQQAQQDARTVDVAASELQAAEARLQELLAMQRRVDAVQAMGEALNSHNVEAVKVALGEARAANVDAAEVARVEKALADLIEELELANNREKLLKRRLEHAMLAKQEAEQAESSAEVEKILGESGAIFALSEAIKEAKKTRMVRRGEVQRAEAVLPEVTADLKRILAAKQAQERKVAADRLKADMDEVRRMKPVTRLVLEALRNAINAAQSRRVDTKEAEALFVQLAAEHERNMQLAQESLDRALSAKDPEGIKAGIEQCRVLFLQDAITRGLSQVRGIIAEYIAEAYETESREERLVVIAKCEILLSLLRASGDEKLRQLHNSLQDLKGALRVFCRVRPISEKEKKRGDTVAAEMQDPFTIGVQRSDRERDVFNYDAVFGPTCTQAEVFAECVSLVQSAFDGYNVTIFTYGQTGAGKTWTLYGSSQEPGVSPRTCELIFDIAARDSHKHEVKVHASMIELYCAELRDLLWRGKDPPKLDLRSHRQPDGTISVHLEGSTQVPVDSNDGLAQVVAMGLSSRKTRATQMNADSSRSHLLLMIFVHVTDRESGRSRRGKITIVDLAGSERLGKSGVTGDAQKEAIEINKSLTALGDVMMAFTSHARMIPYRNHKLTQLMQDSLGGTAKTLMFVNVSPANSNVEESVQSLKYASRARCIENDVRANGGSPGSPGGAGPGSAASGRPVGGSSSHGRRRISGV